MPRFLRRLLARPGRGSPTAHRRRPKIELLEDRCTPALINFVPFSAVADHQLPALTATLPSTALMQFNPLPDVVALAKADATIQTPVHIFGGFQQVLTSPMANPLNTSPLKLLVTYQIDGSVTGAAVAPTATQAGSLTAHVDLTGKYTATLFVPSLTTTFQPPWIITGKFTEKGDVMGPLNAPSPTATDEISFTATIATLQTEFRPSPLASVPTLWSVQSTVQAAGKFEENTVLPPQMTPFSPVAVTSPFSVEDQIDATLQPIPPNGTPPPPATKVSADDNATGTATLYVFPNSTTPPPVVAGATRYLQQMTEKITQPDGSTVDLGQVFATNGFFVNSGLGPIVKFPQGGLAGGTNGTIAVAAAD